MRRELGLLLLWTVAMQASAADDDTDGPGGTRSPGDLTVDERVEMMKQAKTYNDCVHDQARANLAADPDIRRIADLAMGQCEGELDSLGALISGWGMPDYFAEGFTRTVRDRTARKLLPELAISKSR